MSVSKGLTDQVIARYPIIRSERRITSKACFARAFAVACSVRCAGFTPAGA